MTAPTPCRSFFVGCLKTNIDLQCCYQPGNYILQEYPTVALFLVMPGGALQPVTDLPDQYTLFDFRTKISYLCTKVDQTYECKVKFITGCYYNPEPNCNEVFSYESASDIWIFKLGGKPFPWSSKCCKYYLFNVGGQYFVFEHKTDHWVKVNTYTSFVFQDEKRNQSYLIRNLLGGSTVQYLDAFNPFYQNLIGKYVECGMNVSDSVDNSLSTKVQFHPMPCAEAGTVVLDPQPIGGNLACLWYASEQLEDTVAFGVDGWTVNVPANFTTGSITLCSCEKGIQVNDVYYWPDCSNIPASTYYYNVDIPVPEPGLGPITSTPFSAVGAYQSTFFISGYTPILPLNFSGGIPISVNTSGLTAGQSGYVVYKTLLGGSAVNIVVRYSLPPVALFNNSFTLVDTDNGADSQGKWELVNIEAPDGLYISQGPGPECVHDQFFKENVAGKLFFFDTCTGSLHSGEIQPPFLSRWSKGETGVNSITSGLNNVGFGDNSLTTGNENQNTSENGVMAGYQNIIGCYAAAETITCNYFYIVEADGSRKVFIRNCADLQVGDQIVINFSNNLNALATIVSINTDTGCGFCILTITGNGLPDQNQIDTNNPRVICRVSSNNYVNGQNNVLFGNNSGSDGNKNITISTNSYTHGSFNLTGGIQVPLATNTPYYTFSAGEYKLILATGAGSASDIGKLIYAPTNTITPVIGKITAYDAVNFTYTIVSEPGYPTLPAVPPGSEITTIDSLYAVVEGLDPNSDNIFNTGLYNANTANESISTGAQNVLVDDAVGSIVGGKYNYTSGADSLVGGNENYNTGVDSIVSGLRNVNYGDNSIASGRRNFSYSEDSVTVGYRSVSSTGTPGNKPSGGPSMFIDNGASVGIRNLVSGTRSSVGLSTDGNVPAIGPYNLRAAFDCNYDFSSNLLTISGLTQEQFNMLYFTDYISNVASSEVGTTTVNEMRVFINLNGSEDFCFANITRAGLFYNPIAQTVTQTLNIKSGNFPDYDFSGKLWINSGDVNLVSGLNQTVMGSGHIVSGARNSVYGVATLATGDSNRVLYNASTYNVSGKNTASPTFTVTDQDANRLITVLSGVGISSREIQFGPTVGYNPPELLKYFSATDFVGVNINSTGAPAGGASVARKITSVSFKVDANNNYFYYITLEDGILTNAVVYDVMPYYGYSSLVSGQSNIESSAMSIISGSKNHVYSYSATTNGERNYVGGLNLQFRNEFITGGALPPYFLCNGATSSFFSFVPFLGSSGYAVFPEFPCTLVVPHPTASNYSYIPLTTTGAIPATVNVIASGVASQPYVFQITVDTTLLAGSGYPTNPGDDLQTTSINYCYVLSHSSARPYGTAFGVGNSAINSSLANGEFNASLGRGSLASGFNCTSAGFFSTAIGQDNIAKYNGSLCMGRNATDIAPNSFNLGGGNNGSTNNLPLYNTIGAPGRSGLCQRTMIMVGGTTAPFTGTNYLRLWSDAQNGNNGATGFIMRPGDFYVIKAHGSAIKAGGLVANDYAVSFTNDQFLNVYFDGTTITGDINPNGFAPPIAGTFISSVAIPGFVGGASLYLLDIGGGVVQPMIQMTGVPAPANAITGSVCLDISVNYSLA